MDDFVMDFSALRISALSKSYMINKFVDEVTIGPNSIKKSPVKSPSLRAPATNKRHDCEVDSPSRKPPKPAKTSPLQQFTRNAKTIHQVALAQIEKQRKEQEAAAVAAHRQKFENFKIQQDEMRRAQWLQQQQHQQHEIEMQEKIIIQAMQQVQVESAHEERKLIEQNRQRQLANDQLLKVRAEQQQKLIKLINDIKRVGTDFVNVAKEIDHLIKNNPEAIAQLATHINNYKVLQSQFQELCAATVTEHALQPREDILKLANQLKDDITNTLKAYYTKREQAAAQQVALLKQNEEAKAAKAAQEIEHQKSLNENAMPKPSPDDASTLKTYNESQILLQQHEASYKQMLDDPAYKQFKNDVRLAVMLPMNSISDASSQHLFDKYQKLFLLLSGKPVTVKDGEHPVTASNHPQGIAFAVDYLAKKLVAQGYLAVSSNPKAAFAYAAVIVALWNDFPLFGRLVLAHFYRLCPYLVPHRIEKQAGQSKEEYYTVLGYEVIDGKIQVQDHYLKRVAGISRLYFAIMISAPKRGHEHNPFNIRNGWTWFANTLNREPKVEVTATIIYSFLEVAGSTMLRIYGRQFLKIITYLHNYQIPLMKENGSAGVPCTRLEGLLETFKQSGQFVQPVGMLPPDFW